MNKEFPELTKAIQSAKTIDLPQPGSKTYKFKTLPFGERGTKLNSALLKEVTEGIANSILKNFTKFDYIVSPEPGGHIWGGITALKLSKTINILRSQPSYESAELEVRRKKGYYQQNLYFNHFQRNDHVLVIDEVISTGGTIETILDTLVSIDVKPIGVQLIYAKGDNYKRLAKKYSLPIKFLIAG